MSDTGTTRDRTPLDGRDHGDGDDVRGRVDLGRRRFLGLVVAAPTLVAASWPVTQLTTGVPSADALPSPPELAEIIDLTDGLTLAALPTSGLIAVQVDPDGTASFALPRAEVGQGITTAVAMTIAEELDLPLDRVHVTLADARPELLWNQMTGGSNTMHSMFTPVRVAAATARRRLLDAAATSLGVPVASLSTAQGVIHSTRGPSVTYGEVAVAAASSTTVVVGVQLKSPGRFQVVTTPQGRVDAMDIVTGRKRFGMDVEVPDAWPTMVCRPPTINGTVRAVGNLAAVRAMPGVTDVVTIPTGVAVRAQTFGQCIDAVRALQVSWGAGTADGASDASMRAKLVAAELPMAIPTWPLLTRTIDKRFTFAFASNSPLETNNAIADVRPDRAEIWSSMKAPIIVKQRIAEALGLPWEQVTCHVVEGGGSFGRHLFHDAALEAALASQKMGKPVKLMWHRTDDFRQGRMHPMSTTRVRTSWIGSEVLSFEVRHTSVATDYSHGLGEALTSVIASTPIGGTAFSQFFFLLSQSIPYDVGVTGLLLNEVDRGFNTGSMRNVYSPDVTTARELVVDELARQMRKDPLALRREIVQDPASRAVLDRVAAAGQWGRPMEPGTAQGIAIHNEYKSRVAVLAEIDCRPATVARRVRDGFTGPRVTKVVCAVDAGLPINPKGIEAQMQGGIMDGIGLALTFSVHIRDGHSLESSWDNTFYTRQWNAPASCEVIVMPTTTGVPGGIGELGVAPSMAAVACAYARATGTLPTTFPINHDRTDLGFVPLPTTPSIPQSPTDGLD